MTTPLTEAGRDGDSPCGILALLREEASLYEKLHANAARQRSLVVGDDMGPLLASLADRQRLSVELTRISTRLVLNLAIHYTFITSWLLMKVNRLLVKTRAILLSIPLTLRSIIRLSLLKAKRLFPFQIRLNDFISHSMVKI